MSRKMITFYMEKEHKDLLMDMAMYLPGGTASHYIRQLILEDLRARGWVDRNFRVIDAKGPNIPTIKGPTIKEEETEDDDNDL